MSRSIVPAFALFVLLAAGACGGTSSSTQPASQPAASQPAPSAGPTACRAATDEEALANPVTVSIAGSAYDPDPVQAGVGVAINWHNEDGFPHTATLDDIDCGTAQLSRGQEGALVFAEAGTYPYHCRIHSTMHGTITIVP